jgi:hypothetical protein
MPLIVNTEITDANCRQFDQLDTIGIATFLQRWRERVAKRFGECQHMGSFNGHRRFTDSGMLAPPITERA